MFMYTYTYIQNIILTQLEDLLLFMSKLIEPSMPMYIYKVIGYDNTNPDNKINLTTDFFAGNDYFNKVESKYDNYRIEYRYTWKRCKYRYVTCDDTNPFFNLQGIFKRKPFSKKIVFASLSDHSCSDDVLNKIKKYAGPNHDFYNIKLKPNWLFPSDEFKEGDTLTIFDSHGKDHHIDMNINDKISFT